MMWCPVQTGDLVRGGQWENGDSWDCYKLTHMRMRGMALVISKKENMMRFPERFWPDLKCVCKWVSGAELSSAINSFIHNSTESGEWYRLHREWAGMQSTTSLSLFLCSPSLRMSNFPLKTIRWSIWIRSRKLKKTLHQIDAASLFWRPSWRKSNSELILAAG